MSMENKQNSESFKTALEMKSVSKEFPGTLAVDSVDFDVRAGEVHALIGENGAGKSTLMKMIAGSFNDYTGDIVMGSRKVDLFTPAQSKKNGIEMIYQELSLAMPLSIAENVAILVELLLERHMKTLEKVCLAVGDIVDIIRFGDDLGMDSGPFMGLDVYRELFHQQRKVMCDYVHKNSSMHTFLHTCGSIHQFIPDLIDEGIEIINPVQTNCLNMDPSNLKKEFGKDIVFWGGSMDPREILNNKSPEEVKKEAVRRMEILAPDGGFVFNNIHNIMPDVPPENILAFYDAAKEFKY